MTGMEQETLEVISKNKDELHYYSIAQELKISTHYAYVISKGLERTGYVNFDAFRGICSLTKKGEDTIEENWLFKLKKRKENTQKKKKENKKRILKNVEIIKY